MRKEIIWYTLKTRETDLDIDTRVRSSKSASLAWFWCEKPTTKPSCCCKTGIPWGGGEAPHRVEEGRTKSLTWLSEPSMYEMNETNGYGRCEEDELKYEHDQGGRWLLRVNCLRAVASAGAFQRLVVGQMVVGEMVHEAGSNTLDRSFCHQDKNASALVRTYAARHAEYVRKNGWIQNS